MKTAIIITLMLITTAFSWQKDFLLEQKKYEHVKIAYKENGAVVTAKLKNENIRFEDLNIIIIVYKDEHQLEIHAKNKNDLKYKKIITYDICASSGQLGPKRKQGDNQVPEGFYHIDRFNPSSSFYLSLGLNYPNQADRKKSKAMNLGGDIFIHGDCVTIGCIPMNDKIKEIYIYAIQAYENGQLNIPVYIFPFKMDNENMKKYSDIYKKNKDFLSLWNSLKVGYEKFNKNKSELNIMIDNNGDYNF